jgi:outer membrane cobalamin receptor
MPQRHQGTKIHRQSNILNKHFENLCVIGILWHKKTFWSGLRVNISLLSVLVLISASVCKGQHITDTLKIKTIEVYANRIVKEEAGKTTTKIDSIAMIKALTSNLSELISQNTPIFIKEYGRGAMATASFRGTAPSHTQVSWNGITLNSPMLGMVDFSSIPVYFTDNVSLLHGSGSLSEKSGALGGVVKLENTTNWQNKFSGRLLTGIGSYGTRDEFFRINGGNKKIQSQTRAFYNYSNNNYQFVNKFVADIDPQTGKYLYPTQRNENAHYENYGLLQEFYFRPNDKNIFILRYWIQHNDRSLPRLLTNETENNANINRQTENAHRPVVEWKSYGKKGTLSLSSGANIQFLKYQLKTEVSGAKDQVVINSDSRSGSYFLKASYSYQLSDNASVNAGANTGINSVFSNNTPLNGESQGYDRQRQDQSIYVQISKSFGDKLSVTLLTREDFIGGKSNPFIPSAGIDYRPFRNKGFFLKGNLARNYHHPTLNDLYYIPGGNPDLKPEEGLMADLGSGYSGIVGKANFHASLNGYYSRINNWIIWLPTPQGYWEPYNMKRVNASGLEINTGIDGKLNVFDYHFNGNYSFTRSINRDDPRNWADESIGKQLPYIPLHSANILANISRSGYHLTWLWSYYSERFTTTSNDKTSKPDVLYPYFMNNLYLGKEISLVNQKLDIELKIFNLFNEEYRTVLQHPMPRRNYSLLIRYDF